MRIVDEILRRPEFDEAPPVLVDIGASGAMHPKWRAISRYSVCIAFEGDEREAGSLTRARARFRELHLHNTVVAEHTAPAEPFYLTSSPFCSSRLPPDREHLRDYAFAPLFEVVQTAGVPCVALTEALADAGVDRVDWFKSDSQGTDLRLFASLGEPAVQRVLVAEFEPGIIDAYEDEDKLHEVMAYMDQRHFWMSDLQIRGSVRVRSDLVDAKLKAFQRRRLDSFVKSAPGWVEVEYFNDFKREDLLGKREFLLGSVFAFVRRQYAFALELAARGGARFEDAVFERIEAAALRRIRWGYARLPRAALDQLSRRFR